MFVELQHCVDGHQLRNAAHVWHKSSILQYLPKGLFERIKHVGQTLSNIVGRNMFNPFEQHNQTCWTMFDDIGWNLILSKLFILGTSFNIVAIGGCWIRLNTPASNTIQHWSNTVQHHQSMLDNVWPTCLIRQNGL